MTMPTPGERPVTPPFMPPFMPMPMTGERPVTQPFMTSAEYRASEQRSPYVGPRSFEHREALYGREKEADALVDLLLAERIVLLHSPSGAGKTSLLNACITPRLEAEGLEVLPRARVSGLPKHTPEGPWNRYVLSVLTELEKACQANPEAASLAVSSCSLSTYLDRRPRRDPHAPEVLILDQFEELLTLDATDVAAKEEFVRQLGEALKARHRWAIIAMREESMGSLAPYLRHIPTGLAHRVRLPLLSPQAAREAIRRPAENAGRTFRPEAVDQLVNDLGGVEGAGTFIEPVHLQVVCTLIWDKLRPDEKEIGMNDVAEVGGVDDALMKYFAGAVAKAASEGNASERAIRAWIEEHLIVRNRRGQVLSGTEAADGVTPEALRALRDRYVVRLEERRGDTWLELAHDRLVGPILRDNRRWREANLSPFERRAERWMNEGRPDELLVSPFSPRDFVRVLRLKLARAAGHAPPGAEDPMKLFATASLRRSWSRIALVGALLLVGLVATGGALWTGRANERLRSEKARADALADSLARTLALLEVQNRALRGTIEEQDAVIATAPLQARGDENMPPPPPPPPSDTTLPVRPSVVPDRAARPDIASVTRSAPRGRSSSVAASASDPGITVEYFRKPSDPATLERRLRDLGYRVDVRAALDDGLTTNFLAFGSLVTHDDVRAIALALVESGVTLRAICRFASDAGRAGDRSRAVQIIGSTLVARREPVARATILGLAPDQPLPCR